MRLFLVAVTCAALLTVSAPSSARSSGSSGSPVNPFVAANTASARLIFTWTAHANPKSSPRRSGTRTTTPARISSRTQFHGSSAGTVNGYPCGGSLPPCYVLARESGGNPTARNPRSTASGLWQFLDSTWAGYGGYARAYLAPPSVQNEKARLVWANGAGCHHWSAC